MSEVIDLKQSKKTYLRCILITLAVGALSAFLTRNNMDVYSSIEKPPLAPPGILFPIVWTILYTIMGVSLSMVIIKGRTEGIYTYPSLKIYVYQLAVNFFWSIIFFNCRSFLFAFLWLVLLWVLIGIMIFRFYGINKLAAILNIPYFLWVTFAAYLNLMIYILNL